MELEGVTGVQPADEDYQYFFSVMCTGCREEHPKIVSLNQKVGPLPFSTVQITDGRSTGRVRLVWLEGIRQFCLEVSSLQGEPIDLRVHPRPSSDTHLQKEHSASFLPSSSANKSLLPQAYSSANSALSPFVVLDCRGLEFTTFHFRGKWKCVGVESGTPFEFDLDDREENDGNGEEVRWDDYDEKAETPVGVSEMQSKIQKA
ncbi:hypothetical protein P7C73_g4868, partial [Tremellales sp. Uapishka_1]